MEGEVEFYVKIRGQPPIQNSGLTVNDAKQLGRVIRNMLMTGPPRTKSPWSYDGHEEVDYFLQYRGTPHIKGRGLSMKQAKRLYKDFNRMRDNKGASSSTNVHEDLGSDDDLPPLEELNTRTMQWQAFKSGH